MKKIYYLSLASLFIALTACNDYNERNFPELDLTANPTNILSINYEMTSADYTTIANLVKKPVTDSITARKADLAAAKTKVDSTAINAEIPDITNPIGLAAIATLLAICAAVCASVAPVNTPSARLKSLTTLDMLNAILNVPYPAARAIIAFLFS